MVGSRKRQPPQLRAVRRSGSPWPGPWSSTRISCPRRAAVGARRDHPGRAPTGPGPAPRGLPGPRLVITHDPTGGLSPRRRSPHHRERRSDAGRIPDEIRLRPTPLCRGPRWLESPHWQSFPWPGSHRVASDPLVEAGDRRRCLAHDPAFGDLIAPQPAGRQPTQHMADEHRLDGTTGERTRIRTGALFPSLSK